MQIEWLDVFKLTVPLVSAILMVWIKVVIEGHLLLRAKQRTLSRLIGDDLTDIPEAVDLLKRIAESAKHGKLRLNSMDLSSLVPKLALELADLDPKCAYRYANLASSIEVVNKGLVRLSALTLSRASAADPKISARLDRVLVGQANVVALDFVSLGEASIKALEGIPHRNRYQDLQAINTLSKSVLTAKDSAANWPALPKPPEALAALVVLAPDPAAVPLRPKVERLVSEDEDG